MGCPWVGWPRLALAARARPAARAAAAPGVCPADHAGAARQRHRLDDAGSALHERRAAYVTRRAAHSGGASRVTSDAALLEPAQGVRALHADEYLVGTPNGLYTWLPGATGMSPLRSAIDVTHRAITMHGDALALHRAGSMAPRSGDAAQAERQAHRGGGGGRDGQRRCDQRRCARAA